MGIIKEDYKENEKKALEELDNYTVKKVPALNMNSESLSYIYEENNETLGRIVANIFWDTLNIKLFVVSENARGKGIGYKLIEYVENLAKEKGCKHVALETMSFNSYKFYLKNGYEVLGKIENSPLPNETHYYMHKILKDQE